MRNPESEIIRSPQNQLIKRVRSLGLRKNRDAERAFVVEGSRGIESALEFGHMPQVVMLADDARSEVEDLALRTDMPLRIVERTVFDSVMDTATPQGIAAIFSRPDANLPDVTDPFLLVLDGVGDPGNLGTLIRSAAAAGCDAVIVGPACADPWSAKAARSSMGSIFGLPILSTTRELEAVIIERCERRWLADGDGAVDYSEPVWSGGVAIVVGSEGHGASQWGWGLATGSIAIRLANGVDSLNAAVAGSILMFEARRQRMG